MENEAAVESVIVDTIKEKNKEMQYGKEKGKVNKGNMKKKVNPLYSLLMKIIKIKAFCMNNKVSKATQTHDTTLCFEEEYYEQDFNLTYSSIDNEWLQLQEKQTIQAEDNLIQDDLIEDYEFWDFSSEDTDIILNKKSKPARKRKRISLLCCSHQLDTK